MDHFLSGVRGCYELWHARLIHISDEYVQETTPRNLILHLAIYLNVIIRMKCVRCIVSSLSREMSFHGIIYGHQMRARYFAPRCQHISKQQINHSKFSSLFLMQLMSTRFHMDKNASFTRQHSFSSIREFASKEGKSRHFAVSKASIFQ